MGCHCLLQEIFPTQGSNPGLPQCRQTLYCLSHQRRQESKVRIYISKSIPSRGLPGSSLGKESACNAGDSSSIPVLGRSPGEGIGYPLQYSWASMVGRMVKHPPAMWETWVCSLGWEDSLEEGKAPHSSVLAWRISADRGAWWATVHRAAKSQTLRRDSTHT